MPTSKDSLTPDEEMQLLRLWAQSVDIAQSFTPEAIASIPGLREVIEAARDLPAAIGWDAEMPRRSAGQPPPSRVPQGSPPRRHARNVDRSRA